VELFRVLASVVVIGLSVGCASDPGAPEARPLAKSTVDFDRDVRPILSAHCFSCHGPDAAGRQANLRLDQSSEVFAARQNGQPVVIRGNAAASLLYLRITSADNPMPPLTAHLPLTSHEVEVIRRWIDGGADYPDRWFLIAPTRPTPPATLHESWVKNPIDAFVAKKLEESSLEPAPQADPRSLARRVTLALTGLPPTPEAVAAFVADPSDTAYGALVDRLLAEPAYGEQRAHYWLDVARYGDTHGYHMDDYRSAWPYRDYVIRAFNAGMPFDQFTVEQLAGDLLPNATLDQKVATGFVRAAMSTNEGGSFEQEYAAIYAKDRVDTFGKAWLGLTVGCAACHDHKFDPVSQAEFYALTAYFRNSTQPVLDGNAPDAAPSVLVGDTPTLVTAEADTEPGAFVLERGQYDHPGKPVVAGVPAALPPLPAGAPNSRLGLARWLLLPEHPLTARVTANRFWSEIFGVGLVRTAHDFGSTGEAPSHPELLDWLAVEFRESGWNVKALLRVMVTSATYRQSAVVTPDKLRADPENRYLSRAPRFRMDAESVRDLALAASGLLVRTVGGASVKPYQPPGIWEAVAPYDSNTSVYSPDTGDALHRRSLYTFWKRTAPPATLEVFDAPTRQQSVVRRERTNTPLQALVTMNDAEYVEAARALASLALASAETTAERLDFMAQRVLARPLRPEEQTLLTGTLETLTSQYAGESGGELASWTLLANAILNLDEALNQ